MKDQSNVSSSKTGKSRSSSSLNEKSGGLTATLASWIAPSPSSSATSSSNKDQQPSQRATSIPNPAGASASSPIEIHDDEAHHYTTSSNETAPRPSLGPSSRRPPSTSTLSALLEPFNPSPHSSNRDTDGRIRIPATSRAGADIAEQKTATGVGLLESWKYLPFLAHQGESNKTCLRGAYIRDTGVERHVDCNTMLTSCLLLHLPLCPTSLLNVIHHSRTPSSLATSSSTMRHLVDRISESGNPRRWLVITLKNSGKLSYNYKTYFTILSQPPS